MSRSPGLTAMTCADCARYLNRLKVAFGQAESEGRWSECFAARARIPQNLCEGFGAHSALARLSNRPIWSFVRDFCPPPLGAP